MLAELSALKTNPALLDALSKIALDRGSLRTVDADGRLHVAKCNISKATVNPYLGREIPGAEALGLDPNRIYYLYRDPLELAAAAQSFHNMPLTLRHVIVNAENPAQEQVVGTVSNPNFEDPYLTASLSVWTAEAKALVESGEVAQISCAYRYRVDMTPGTTPDGLAYHGVMRDIIANHVALVEEGRAGPDVIVADSKPLELPKMKSTFLAALVAALAPVITFKPEQLVALDAALDADMDDEATDSALSDEEKSAACDAYAEELKKASDSLTDEEKDEAYKRASDRKAKDAKAKDGKEPEVGGAAQDGKLFTQADVDAARAQESTAAYNRGVAEATANLSALHTAREAVKTVVGVVTCDSAAAVYKLGLDKLGIVLDGVPESAYGALFAAASKLSPAATTETPAAPVALPALGHIKVA